MDYTQQALEEIREIVGHAFVLTASEDIERLSRVTIPSRKKPLAFVYPANVADIQRIVVVANTYKVPLWPCSKGRNWGYGSATAACDDAIVLVLERLNRILEVNEELAYVVIEPGVTYRQLHAHLKQNGIKLWCDCTDGPPEGSVIGNALERGIGETPYGDHFGNLCGMEVILPDGTLVHTGGGSLQQLKTWHTHKWGTGPYLEGLFTQSNFGIVTRAGMWLMPEPEAFNSFTFDLHRQEDFPLVIDALRRLALQRIIQTKIHMINDFVTLAVIAEYPRDLLKGETFLSDAVLTQLRQRYAIASWSFGAGIYGTPAQVRVDRRIIKRTLGQYGSLRFLGKRRIHLIQRLLPWLRKVHAASAWGAIAARLTRLLLGKPLELVEAAPHLHGILQGIPTEYFVRHAYFRSGMPRPDSDVHPARDGCGEIWFAPIVPFTGKHVVELLDSAKTLFQKHGLDFYVALLLMNPRSVIPLMAIFYQRENPEETERASALYGQLCELATSLDYQQYRAAIPHWERIFEKAPEFLDLNNTLKRALDPYSILAPGKYGIVPRDGHNKDY